MSGHSKWAGIKHKKAIVDAKRGAAFTKLAREVTIAAREGNSGDPETNFRLRLAVQKAREANMPADKIQSAIDRGTGAAKGESLEELRYEGYGPQGVAIMVDAVTDNRNRTAPMIRHAFSKHGGNLGETNSVAWMFNRTGLITVDPKGQDPELLALEAIELGADDVQVEGDLVEVYVVPERLEELRQALLDAGRVVERAEVTMQATNPVEVEAKHAAAVVRLLEALEEHDDVREVHCNAILPDDVLAQV